MKKKKGFSERGFEEEKGEKRGTLDKPYPHEEKEERGENREAQEQHKSARR